MYYKKTIRLMSFFLCLLLLSSCAEVKNIAYFQKIERSNNQVITEKKTLVNNETQTKKPSNYYEARIKPKDLLSITVVSSEPEVSRMYNLVVPQIAQSSVQNQLLSEPILQTYLVDNEGNIEFPVFGKINVKDLTRKELEVVLHEKLASAFSKEIPIVTIRFVNYSVNILGEVLRPGKYETNNDRLTIFDGLALAGDLTIYGRRDNVKVLRERADGYKMYITVNLNDRNVVFSPGYYLEQNDVVYIEPNKSKSRSSNYGAAETFGISSLSVLLTLTSLIFTVFNVKL
jgi:polysaccharide biosynthesis/export protein